MAGVRFEPSAVELSGPYCALLALQMRQKLSKDTGTLRAAQGFRRSRASVLIVMQ